MPPAKTPLLLGPFRPPRRRRRPLCPLRAPVVLTLVSLGISLVLLARYL